MSASRLRIILMRMTFGIVPIVASAQRDVSSGISLRDRKGDNMRRKKIGVMDFHGSVDITDPCYDRDTWCRMNDVKIKEGSIPAWSGIKLTKVSVTERRIHIDWLESSVSILTA